MSHLNTSVLSIAIFVFVFWSLFRYVSPEENATASFLLSHFFITIALSITFIHNAFYGIATRTASHKATDFIFLLFLFCIANVYYSEISFVSWRTLGLTFDAFAVYYIARSFLSQHLLKSICLFFAMLLLNLCLAGKSSALSTDSNFCFIRLFLFSLSPFLLFFIFKRISALHIFAYFCLFACIFLSVSIIISNPIVHAFSDKDFNEISQNIITITNSLSGIFFAYPIFGCGVGTFPTLATNHSVTGMASDIVGFSSIALFLELGCLGSVLFIIVLWSHLKESFWALIRTGNSLLRLRILMCLTPILFIIVLFTFSSGYSGIAMMMTFAFFMGLSSSHGYLTKPDVHTQPDLGLSSFESVKLGGALATILLVALCVAAPDISERQLTKASLQSPNRETVEELYRINARFPYNDGAWFALAKNIQCAVRSGATYRDSNKAISEAILKAIQLNPYVADYHIALAQETIKDPAKSNKLQAVLSKGVSYNPHSTTLRLMFSRDLALNSKNASALENAKYALIFDSKSRIELLIILSDYLSRDGVLPASLRYLQYGLQRSPDTRLNPGKLSEIAARNKFPDSILSHFK